MSNTALLALSSPEGSDNYFSRLVNQIDEDTGLKYFRVCDCLLICEACRKLERDEQVKCNHVKQQAHWLSKRKTSKIAQLYKTDPATAIKELYGGIEDDYAPCFPKEDIARFFARPPLSTNFIPKYVAVCVDPNGGGPSQLAIVSGYYDASDTFVILGIDSELVKTKVAIKNTLRGHFERINQISRFKGVMKVFIPEKNLANEATHMNSMIKRLGDVRTYWQKDDKPGVNKDADTSDNYQFLMYNKLQNNDIVFDMDAFTTSRTETLADKKMQLREQMESYHYEYDPKRNKVKLTGKSSDGKQDDLNIALMMGPYWLRNILRDKCGRLA